ncbi:beta-ketoacyl synthase N-terminal-like domain-containing protein [Nocardiopsis tropica]|uniref:Beta-ketoacyl synthase N-terminal-like domain-containing protein n=1 Tax=Nocardiopsis tropica TaxID=109330 RepID=A0ABU7KKS5_9ACTN|nr:beta-ketoacyl synthase N-terminal-like domain-containing protein [Nocardiopsis umidischolae]MEE2049747.1 beta-ketoacyl synthase N-terminal-like domain-containing protein [Nocardiopsis umidischolae]
MSGTETQVLRQALERIRELKKELGELRRGSSEAVAIVGIGLEMAGGVADPQQLWNALLDRRECTSPVPDGRWPRTAMDNPDLYTTAGAYLGESAFDPELFKVSPRESAGLDPQQKAILKTTWWALEDAGLTASDIAGTRTGVYVGVGSDDFTRAAIRNLAEIDSHKALGGARSLAAGRLAYFLDAKGPVASIDTACSSSLVGVHLGVQSLRSGESDRIVVAGVNLMLHPSTTMGFCKLGALSATGRCRAFDAAANGYVRGEGAVSLILERESDARAAGRRILALIHGSAIGHDGHSNGLTAPNGTSQEGVIRAALVNSRVDPADVGYVEAHATGTALGDPIELSALARVFGGSSDRPLWVGSLKANFGHLEAGAGLASLVKTVQVLRHGTIPPQPNLDTPNPRFAWERHRLRVATSPEKMPQNAVLAGVSAFGMSGTNAHVVVGAGPRPSASGASPTASDAAAPTVMTFAAPTGSALQAQADQAVAELDRAEVPTAVLAGSIRDKDSQPYRLAVVGRSRKDLSRAIGRAAARSTPTNGRPRFGVAFGGQGVFRPGVGERLSRTFPEFRNSIEESEKVFHEVTGESLTWILRTGGTSPHLHQAATTALHLALGRVLTTAGIEPDFWVGHSLGEYAAAVHAGVMTAETAMRLVSHRAVLCAGVDWSTTLMRINGEPEGIRRLLEASGAAVALVNGGREVVVTVTAPQRASLQSLAEASALTFEDVPIAAPYHTEAMAEVARAFGPIVESESLRLPTSDILPGLADRTGDDMARPGYWVDHLIEPFRFDQCLTELRERDADVLLELGAAPVVAPLALRDRAVSPEAVVPSLRVGREELDSFLGCAATLYTKGVGLRWSALLPTSDPIPSSLRYRFSREPLIPTFPVEAEAPTGPEPALVRLDRSQAVVADHVIAGRTVIAAAYQLRMYRELATRLGIDGRCAITDVEFREPLEIGEEGAEVALSAVPGQDRWSAKLSSADGTTVYSRCRLEPLDGPPPPIPPPDTEGAEEIDTDDFYRTFRAVGYELGDNYTRLRSLSVLDDRRAVGSVTDTESPYTGLQPGTLDSCLQVLAAPLVARGAHREVTLVPFHIERVEMAGPTELRHHPYSSSAEVVDVGERVLVGSLTVTASGQDRPAVVVRGLRARVFHGHDQPSVDSRVWDLSVTWCPTGQVPTTGNARVLVMGDPDEPTGTRFGHPAIPWPRPTAGAEADDLRAPAEEMAEDVAGRIESKPDPVTVVVVPPTGRSTNQRGLAMVWALLQTMVALERAGAASRVRWIVLTVGPPPHGPYPADPAGAAAWAAFRSVALETPDMNWHLAHVVNAGVDEIRRAVETDLTTFVVDGPDVLVPHLAWERASSTVPALGPAVVLGARGSLGNSVVEHLIDQGRTDTVAVLRNRAEDYEESHAGRVRAVTLPGRPSQWSAAIARTTARHGDRPSLLHLAGTAANATMVTATWPMLRDTWLSKASLAEAALVPGLPLTVATSLAAFLGSPGQSGYAAANGYVEGLLADQERSATVALGPVADTAMAAASGSGGPAWARAGVEPLPGAIAVQALLGSSSRTLLAGDMSAIAPLAEQQGYVVPGHRDTSSEPRHNLFDGVREEDRERVVLAAVTERLSELLHASPDDITPDLPLLTLGVDSLIALELRSWLQTGFGVSLTVGSMFDEATIRTVARAVVEAHFGDDGYVLL